MISWLHDSGISGWWKYSAYLTAFLPGERTPRCALARSNLIYICTSYTCLHTCDSTTPLLSAQRVSPLRFVGINKHPPLPMLCELEQTAKTNTWYLVKKLSTSYSILASYVGYLAGVCRLRCASVWQSVQQHSRTGPQPGSIFHPRNVGIRGKEATGS